MARYLVKDESSSLIALSLYALRQARTQDGLPGHPKLPHLPDKARICRELKSEDDFFAVAAVEDHLQRLIARYGLADAPQKRRLQSADKIQRAFADKPLPLRGKNVHSRQLAHESGVPLRDLKTPECQEMIEALMARNGGEKVELNFAADRSAFARYAAELERSNSRVPVNTATGKPHITRIAAAIGVPPGRFQNEPLNGALETLVARIGLEPVRTQEEEIVDLEAFIRARLPAGPPLKKDGTPCIAAISEATAIVPHRLKKNKHMRALIAAWRENARL